MPKKNPRPLGIHYAITPRMRFQKHGTKKVASLSFGRHPCRVITHGYLQRKHRQLQLQPEMTKCGTWAAALRTCKGEFASPLKKQTSWWPLLPWSCEFEKLRLQHIEGQIIWHYDQTDKAVSLPCQLLSSAFRHVSSSR